MVVLSNYVLITLPSSYGRGSILDLIIYLSSINSPLVQSDSLLLILLVSAVVSLPSVVALVVRVPHKGPAVF
jgi:hypothetical protein